MVCGHRRRNVKRCSLSKRSGMTGAQFARFVGVRYSTLMFGCRSVARKQHRARKGTLAQ